MVTEGIFGAIGSSSLRNQVTIGSIEPTSRYKIPVIPL